MRSKQEVPDFIFEASWEVCNKVGGIYTVLSSRAKTLQAVWADKLCFIGPDIHPNALNHVFEERAELYPEWREAAAAGGLKVRIGRWLVPGRPVAVLVDYSPFFERKNDIYASAWRDYGVDSLHAYGDYDEASMFSFAAGRFAELVCRRCIGDAARVVYQAHEWMAGLGMLYLKKQIPSVATIFTTHATSIGRSITSNNKQLYAYFEGYDGDQMARELNMEAKHSIEKQSAMHADCFTTVSRFTDRECRQLLKKGADVVLPNGFEPDFVPKGTAFTSRRKMAKQKIREVVACLTGAMPKEDVLIVSTSGRNDFRCKGFDVFLEAMARLKAKKLDREVVALLEVPCWTKGPRHDLLERLSAGGDVPATALYSPVITHDLYDTNENRILNMMKQLSFENRPEDKVKVVLVPCYLEGHDGIFNLPYYDMLIGSDLCIYPSYYEPWGYTPLESCAFKTPCITTDLSGFGQWVDDILGRSSMLRDGVAVLHRTDANYFETADAIVGIVEERLCMTGREAAEAGRKAAAVAAKAQWKHFIKYYYEAYDYALRHRKADAKQNIHK